MHVVQNSEIEAAVQAVGEFLAEIRYAVPQTKTERLDVYWNIGRIVMDTLSEDGAAPPGQTALCRLGATLEARFGCGFSSSNLRNMCRFFKAYLNRDYPAQLPWTHCCVLAAVEDVELRQRLTVQAVDRKWSARELRVYTLKPES